MYLENAAVQVQVARALTKFYSSKGSQAICVGRSLLILVTEGIFIQTIVS